MSATKAAKGTKIQRGDGAGPEVFTTIAEVKSFNGPSESMGSIDTTSFDSTAKEHIADGMLDGGEVTLAMLFVGNNTAQQGLRTDLRAGTLRNFKLLLNDAALDADKTTFAFTAQVTKIGLAGAVGAGYDADVTLKISGIPTFTPADA